MKKTVQELIKEFNQLVEDFEFDEAKEVADTLRVMPGIIAHELLGFKTWGQLTRRLCIWGPQAIKNKEYVLRKLTEFGFIENKIYLPRTIYNADKIVITSKDDVVEIRCSKERFEDYIITFDKSRVIYFFEKKES